MIIIPITQEVEKFKSRFKFNLNHQKIVFWAEYCLLLCRQYL